MITIYYNTKAYITEKGLQTGKVCANAVDNLGRDLEGLILAGMCDTIVLCRLHTNLKKGREKGIMVFLNEAKQKPEEGF